jgi:foldase protein PrsA
MALGLTGCTSSLAAVNGYKITQAEIDKYLSSVKVQNPDMFKPENKNDLLKAEAQLIDYLIENKLIEKYAAEKNISFTEKEFSDEYTKLQTTSFKTKEEFTKYLKDNGVPEELLISELKSQLLAKKVFDIVTADIKVSDADISAYYEQNKAALFANPDQIRISHILVQFGDQDTTKKTKEAALEKINMVAQKIKDGETFENMANKYSEDPNSNTKGGDIGYFSKGQLVAEFENVAFAMETGMVSDVVETSYGFHLIKVTDKKAASIKTLDEVKDSIKTSMENTLKSNKFTEFLLTLKEAAKITYSKTIEDINNATTTTAAGGSATTGAGSSSGQSTTTQEQLVTPSSK